MSDFARTDRHAHVHLPRHRHVGRRADDRLRLPRLPLDQPANHRYRCSVLIGTPRGNILIDTTPELRLQLLRENVKLVHAVVYTHYHVDHLFGLDDLRLFPTMLQGAAADLLHRRGGRGDPAGVRLRLPPRRRRPARRDAAASSNSAASTSAPFEVLGERFTPIPLVHGRFNVLGFRIGNVAYCTDVSAIPDRSWPLLEGLEVLVIDALRPASRTRRTSASNRRWR